MRKDGTSSPSRSATRPRPTPSWHTPSPRPARWTSSPQGDGGELEIVQENLDECVLCRLCLDATPEGAVRVLKLYDNEAVLA